MVNKGGYIKADFEDAFLCDGKRSLKIKFNPKISSFKTTFLESKLILLEDIILLFLGMEMLHIKNFKFLV